MRPFFFSIPCLAKSDRKAVIKAKVDSKAKLASIASRQEDRDTDED